MPITGQQIAGHAFLRQMYDDSYFPDRIVDRGKAILLRLCERIEAEQPSDLGTLCARPGCDAGVQPAGQGVRGGRERDRGGCA